jgi:hypothetical protein
MDCAYGIIYEYSWSPLVHSSMLLFVKLSASVCSNRKRPNYNKRLFIVFTGMLHFTSTTIRYGLNRTIIFSYRLTNIVGKAVKRLLNHLSVSLHFKYLCTLLAVELEVSRTFQDLRLLLTFMGLL